MNYFLLIYFLLYFFLAFVWKSIVVSKKLGRSILVLPSTDDAYGVVGRYFKFLILITFLYLILFVFYSNEVLSFGNLKWFSNPFASLVGFIALVLALAITIKAQYDMGNSWRIGIDDSNSSKLISVGVFKYSRNPIFFGMLMAMAGLTMLLPTLVSFSLFTIAIMLINIQIRLEESYLRKAHGKAYENYYEETPRFLTFL